MKKKLIGVARDVFGIDFRTLATLRIATSAVLLVDLIIRATDLHAHYTDYGAFPREKVFFDERNSPFPMSYLSIHLMSGHWSVQAALFLVEGIAALALLLGHRTRIASVVSWGLWISLLARNTAVLQASDHLLKLVLFWGMFLPWGARGSADAWWSRKKGRPGEKFFGVASVALLWQVCSVYLFSVLWKYGPEWRTDYSATYFALSLDQFATPLGKWLLGQREWLAPLTVATFWLEALGPVFLLFPYLRGTVRSVALLALMGMHFGYGVCLDLGGFSWVCVVALVAFIPGEWWDAGKKILPRFSKKTARWSTWARALFKKWPVPAKVDLSVRPWESAVGGLALAAGLVWNLAGLPYNQGRIGLGVRAPASVLHVDQQWGMFAPFPFKEDGWFVIDAKLRNGDRVDLFRRGQPVDYRKPANISGEYANGRWRKFMMNLWEQRYQNDLGYFTPYLCREWNGNHAVVDWVDELEVVFVRETTLPNYLPPTPTRISLAKYTCAGR